jgi:DNA-binding CsgD family transcriptional regulator
MNSPLVLVIDDESAVRWSEEGLRRLEQAPHPAHLAPLLAAAATAYVRASASRPDAARDLLATARAMVDQFAERGILAEAEVVTATAELSGGVGHWRAAAEAWEGVGDPFRAAYAHLRLAEELLASTEDRPEAAEHLRTALSTARRIGAQGLLRQAEDLGRRSRLRVEAAPDNPYRLTRRELEVLRLVADGLTDRAIGGRLFISHRTVERHVSNLLSKLEVGRRAELVATAHRDGLLAPHDDSSAG